jgi:UDP-glucose 4-epimerase
MRVALASSVNVLPMVFSAAPHFAYFPIDEAHPTEPDEPYGLSKVCASPPRTPVVSR